MIRCLKDISISEDSKCAKCCLHCDEKETCKYKCSEIDKYKSEDDEYEIEESILRNCTDSNYW